MAGSTSTVTFAFLCLFSWLTFQLCIRTAGSAKLLCIPSEQEALLQFKQNLLDPWNRLQSWSGNNSDCCTWEGVVCNSVTGHVLELHLGSFPSFQQFHYFGPSETDKRRRFGGEVNPCLLDLKHLNHLDLSSNDFGGMSIPSFIGSMRSLTYLNLSKAGFGGKIPYQLGNLSNLLYLDLKTTRDPPKFSGKIPSEIGNLTNLIHLNLGSENDRVDLFAENLQWLSTLSSLEYLDLTNANLSKASDWLWVTHKLPALKELHLFNCPLHYDNQPSTINFSSLVNLDLSYTNHFEASFIPKWIFGLKKLNSFQLAGNHFQDSIPHDIQNLTMLENIDLSENLFNSSIPSWLYSLNHLKSLNLNKNNLHGTVSNDIANLTSIVSLNLMDNHLEGKFPTSFASLCNLRKIYLSFTKCNQKVSEILEILSECVSDQLENLVIVHSKLSGNLTDKIGVFKNLVQLDLQDNSIQGILPRSLGKLSSLEYLSISKNQFQGNPFEIVGQLSKLQILYLGFNQFQGVVTQAHFPNLTRLMLLDAPKGQLTLKVNSNWTPPFQLRRLLLKSWRLGPNFPTWIRSQKDLQQLDLTNTSISDSIPSWFWSTCSNAYWVCLYQNQLYGDLSKSLENPISIESVDLSSNHFSGQLPYLSPDVVDIDLSMNSFSGSIARFLCQKQGEPTKLEFLNLKSNKLSGEIPDCWMMQQDLLIVELANNSFTGNIPASMGSLVGLKSLQLGNNKISGKFPPFLKNFSQLVSLDLGKNKISGTIPSWIGEKLTNLKILSLRSNKIFGQIPLGICKLEFLQFLDLAENNFTGHIPKCFKNLKAMARKNASADSRFHYIGKNGTSSIVTANLYIKGADMEYGTILGLVTNIDLSNNKLSGDIPTEITSLLALLSLNLSKNFLNGQIPKNIGNMGALESLDLSRNQLFGEIPTSIANLSFLSKLNLSFNNLSGKIPTGTQLQSFEESSFIGNNLCGLPLYNSCITHHINNKYKGGGHEINWFYVSMAFGFIVGFGGFVGPLFLYRSWRYAYFQFIDNMWYKVRYCL
ncbi:hypothetical protein L6164_003222 [Bauhinia variegata]|uniref:Uncharacterized protein n=1 Tax=Bauhinia variegata TaxID=167791 RepID=A0ACB9Q0K0_BAUVA|nr:hypothetical protein L6164_003222 [Bauhinia variegata]